MGLPQHPCWWWSFCTSWKLRLVDFGKVEEIQYRIQCLWFLSLLQPKIESHWIQTPLCVMNVHICPRVHWNRPPFEMDTGFSAIGVANGYWFPLPFHVCWNEVSGIFFFLSGRRFLLFCQKVRVCCPLQLIKRPHHDLASESRCAKYTIQNLTVFSINRSYVLQLWQANTVPYSTKPAERVLPAHSRINMDPFLRAE